mmetsp:Transcript_14710/g.46902  ORF Transcript_14710/g.46902 Transcript_14710/m.46902 type:complete len:273 (+) Transcript_14710:133-951(+)
MGPRRARRSGPAAQCRSRRVPMRRPWRSRWHASSASSPNGQQSTPSWRRATRRLWPSSKGGVRRALLHAESPTRGHPRRIRPPPSPASKAGQHWPCRPIAMALAVAAPWTWQSQRRQARPMLLAYWQTLARKGSRAPAATRAKGFETVWSTVQASWTLGATESSLLGSQCWSASWGPSGKRPPLETRNLRRQSRRGTSSQFCPRRHASNWTRRTSVPSAATSASHDGALVRTGANGANRLRRSLRVRSTHTRIERSWSSPCTPHSALHWPLR